MFFNKANKKVQCFSCNNIGYLANDCRVKKSVKCFNCNKFGHCAKDCKCPRQNKKKIIVLMLLKKRKEISNLSLILLIQKQFQRRFGFLIQAHQLIVVVLKKCLHRSSRSNPVSKLVMVESFR